MARRAFASLALVALGTTLSAALASVSHVALPVIASGFGGSAAAAAVFQACFAIGLMIALLPAGLIADALTPARAHAVGYVVFALGCLWCANAECLLHLGASRLIQAAGAALVLASTAPLVVALAPNHRGTALGVILATTHVGWIVGPAAGGVLLSVSGWRELYTCGGALAAVAIATWLACPPFQAVPTGRRAEIKHVGSTSTFFVIAALVSYAVLGTVYALALSLRTQHAMPLSELGGLFALQSAATALGATAAGVWSSCSSRFIAALGSALAAVGLVGIAATWPGDFTTLTLCLAAAGVGTGAASTSVTEAIVSDSAIHRRCRAGAWLSLARNGGHALGVGSAALLLAALDAPVPVIAALGGAAALTACGLAMRSGPSMRAVPAGR